MHVGPRVALLLVAAIVSSLAASLDIQSVQIARAAELSSAPSGVPAHTTTPTKALARTGARKARRARRSEWLRILSCTAGGESISPCTQSDTLGAGGQTQRTFTVLNNSPEEDFTTTGCTVSGAAASCSVSPTSLDIPNGGASRAFTVTFHAGNTAGTGTVTATTSGNADLSATITLTVLPPPPPPIYSVSVTPDSDRIVTDSGGNTEVPFYIRNTGTDTTTFGDSVTCTNTVGTMFRAPCSVLPASVRIPPNGLDTVLAFWTSGAAGAQGRVRLKAAQASPTGTASDTGWLNVVSRPLRQDSTRLNVASVNPGATLTRDLCLTIDAGEDAAWECGDLRLVHALPSVRTFDELRTPTLLYNSQQAHPHPSVAVLVNQGDSTFAPDTLVATLTMGAVTKDSVKLFGGPFQPGKSERIALSYDALNDSSGMYPYTVTVRAMYNAGGVVKQSSAKGTLLVVNRSGSRFGAGWWLAGWEQLYFHGADTLLWIGGDGSARIYAKNASGTFTAPSVDRPDTITTSGGIYTRKLIHGAQVQFDSLGRHIATINRLHRKATFYVSTSRLDSVSVPTPPLGPRRVYRLTYDGNGKIQAIAGPTPDSRPRTATISVVTGRLRSITDPDTAVSFKYDSVSDVNRMLTSTNKRGITTTYTYDSGHYLASSSLNMGSGVPAIVRRFHNPDSVTLSRPGALAAPIQSDSAFARQAGPRGDTTVAWFWLDGFGQPVLIQDALHHQTVITRGGDARWPALATRELLPNGRILLSTYDARGNPASVTDSTHRSGSTLSTTRYEFHQTWDYVTKIVPPMLDSTVIAYDDTVGNRIYQQDARGVSSRVNFSYNTVGELRLIVPPVSPPDTILYDTTGLANVSRVASPIGALTSPRYVSSRTTRDSIGRPVYETSPIDTLGQRVDTVWHRYDLMSRDSILLSWGPWVPYMRSIGTFHAFADSTPPESLQVQQTYDRDGNLLSLTRQAFPNPNSLSLLTTSWTYDNADRRITERAPDGAVDSTIYDLGGNVVRTHTRRGYDITVQYDSLNRVTTRIRPAVTYAQQTFGGWPWRIPLYNPFGGSGIPISADTALFSYDAVGDMLSANNYAARIKRAYNLDGTLASDTLTIRADSSSVTPTDSVHVYGLRYGYDLESRRTKLIHPDNIAPRQTGSTTALDSVAYTYGVDGRLATIRNVVGDVYQYFYDAEGRQDSLSYPGGVGESWAYNAAGLVARRIDGVANAFVGTAGYRGFATNTIHSDTLLYDARGKLIAAHNLADSAGLAYSALGNLAWAWDGARGALDNVEFSKEVYNDDALGNTLRAVHTANGAGAFVAISDSTTSRYGATTGRLNARQGFGPFNGGGTSVSPSLEDSTGYDAAGNKLFGFVDSFSSTANLTDNTWNFYDASDHLRVVDRRTCVSQPNQGCSEVMEPGQDHRGAFDMYRYDAFDRRVLVRSLVDSACFYQFCPHTLERTVWDGDEVLYEIRYRGGNSSLSSEPDTISYPDTISGVLYHPYGRVAYTNGPTLDQPLDIIRMGFDVDSFVNPIVLIPHKDWHDRYDVGSYDDGSKNRCTNYNDITSCVTIYWPAPFMYVQYESSNNGLDAFRTWFGERLADMRDGSGELYMRNRYYDPSTGRFTQEDPIGVEGGLNLYGFANGDPINLSDPFGLCPPCGIDMLPQIAIPLPAAGAAVGGAAALPVIILTAPLVGYLLPTDDAPPMLPSPNAQRDVTAIALGASASTVAASDFNLTGILEKGGHRTHVRESNRPKHQRGEARRKRDQGNEKGDKRRKPNPSKRRKVPDDNRSPEN